MAYRVFAERPFGRTALQDAASVAAILVITEAVVAEKLKKEEPMLGGGPGMGGEGGMM